MRLIDADMLMKEIQSFRCSITGLRAGKGVLAHAADEYRKSILQIIDDQPTAFDKEKVIEELKEMATHSASCKNQCEFGSTEYFDYMGAEVAYKTTIEIIEKGGLN